MTHETAGKIFKEIVESARGDDALETLMHELWSLAVRYARLRTDWRLATTEARRGMDAARRRAHDALIAHCNIVSRAVGRAGRDNRWRAALTDDRKEIGDFACHAHAILGVQAR